jgi:hypothetical protein
MTLYCAADECGELTMSVSVPLARDMARDLAIRLWLAADETDCSAK